MALEQRSGGTYITVYQGKFCQRVDKGTEGAKSRINKMNKEVWELFYDSFTGVLFDIKVRDSEYGKTWNIIFKDGEEFYTIQLPYSGAMSSAFLKMLPNIDVSRPIQLSPQQKEVDGKTKSSLFINQNGTHIKHAYTRDVPNGLPPLKKITVKGKETWDDSDQLEFLFDMVNTKIKPKLGKDVLVEGPSNEAPKIPTQDEVDEALGRNKQQKSKTKKEEINAEEIDF